jgi:two-component system C4-dicarboxylate transport response regulator DctD
MTTRGSVYIVDDEESMRIAVSQWLTLAGYRVKAFSSAREMLNGLDKDFDGVLVTDIRMPDIDGMELMQMVLRLDREIPIVLVTAHGDIPMAVSAMRDGAYDFIEKPFEPEMLLETVRRAGEKRKLVLENRRLRQSLENSDKIETRLLGTSDAIQFLHQEIRDLGPTDASVFLIGETGCGKEVVARCLHELSSRKRGKFVAINCGAIPETLFESELFGHEAGAFTGATGRRIGKFEHADGGTLFLDEVNSMPLSLQVKVLRVLQEREIERLGANNSIPIDIRIISATNCDPRKACSEGRFREDLYYRLNVAEINIPPLRKRPGDILLLFDYFLLRSSEKYNRELPHLTGDAIAMLMAYPWPGNVRELKNIAERYILSSLPPGERIAHILQHTGSGISTAASSLAEQAANFEKCVIDQALRRHGGNIASVLEELGLPRRTLNQKMQNHGLSRKDYLNTE